MYMICNILHKIKLNNLCIYILYCLPDKFTVKLIKNIFPKRLFLNKRFKKS